jgi:WD40 repeat protein
LLDLAAHRESSFTTPHASRPVSLAFSVDGKRLAVGCEDRSIVVRDLASGRIDAELIALDGPPGFLGFGGDGASLVVSEGDKTLAIHSLKSTPARHVLPIRGPAAVAISRAGDRLAVGGGEEPITLWDLDAPSEDPRLLGRLLGAKRLLFSDDGQFLFAAFPDPSIRVLRLTKAPHPRRILAGHSKEAWAVAFDRGGDVAASGADDGMIKLWDVVTGAELAAVPAHTETVSGLAFSPREDELASVSLDGAVKVWALRRDPSGAPAATLELRRVLRESEQSQLRCVAYSADGATLAASGLDPVVHIWDAARLAPLRRINTSHGMMITALAFSPMDNKQLATASCDGTIMIWNTDSGARLDMCETNGSAMSLAYSPSGRRLATSGQPRVIEMWDTNTRSPLDVIIGHPDAVRSIAFSPDGRTVATGCDDGRVRLCDAETNQIVIILDEHHGRINSVAFSPDGSTLASCSHSGEVFFWHSEPPDASFERSTDDESIQAAGRAAPPGQAEAALRR